jgi:hypothetical protein
MTSAGPAWWIGEDQPLNTTNRNTIWLTVKFKHFGKNGNSLSKRHSRGLGLLLPRALEIMEFIKSGYLMSALNKCSLRKHGEMEPEALI